MTILVDDQLESLQIMCIQHILKVPLRERLPPSAVLRRTNRRSIEGAIMEQQPGRPCHQKASERSAQEHLVQPD